MHTVLFVFEFLGTTELLVVAVVALILFGPRKLPEIGRTVGKALGEFKRASDDFKRTWEYEVELERRKPALETGAAEAAAPADAEVATADATADAEPAYVQPEMWGTPIARGSEDVYARPADDGEPEGDATKRAGQDDQINAS